jgi:hypothetical protein
VKNVAQIRGKKWVTVVGLLKGILKNFFFEHLGKIIIIVIIVVFVMPAFPDQTHDAFEGINEIGSSLVSLAVARREFILGFILTLLLTYLKDSVRSSREARWAGGRGNEGGAKTPAKSVDCCPECCPEVYAPINKRLGRDLSI